MPELILLTLPTVMAVLWGALMRGADLYDPPPVETPHELTEAEVDVEWAAMVARLQAEEPESADEIHGIEQDGGLWP